MALRAWVPISSVSRCITASRHYTTASPGASSSRGTHPKASPSDEHRDFTDEAVSRSTPAAPPGSGSPLDSSAAKIFSHTGPVILRRRPPVRPPPTLVLPPSVSSLPLRSSPKKKKSFEPQQGSTEGGGEPAADDLWEVYQESLTKYNTEPTIEDLEALRPAASTIRAALNGVLGAGRTLLPEGHQLHLDLEHLGAQEVPVGGGPHSKKTVVAGSGKARKLEYLALYEATESLINHRFTAAQLHDFEGKLSTGKISRRKNDSKQKMINRIMNSHFKMMHPLVIKGELAELAGRTEECRDGENLLQVSKDLHLNISVDRDQPAPPTEPSGPNDTQTPPRFVLRASGARTNHQELKKYLEQLRKSISVRVVVLPTGPPLSPSRLQNISRTAGAFCENVNRSPWDPADEAQPPSVLITARNKRSAYTAERLVQRAALEDKHRSHVGLVSLIQPAKSTSTGGGSPEYSLYPFDTQNFRLQRVKHLNRLPAHASLENLVHFQYQKARPERAIDSDEAVILNDPTVVSGLEGRGAGQGQGQGQGEDLLVIEDDPRFGDMVAVSPRGEPVDLRQLLFDPAQSTAGSVQKVTATFGHVIFKASSTTLLPPLKGPVSIEPALEWVANQANNLRSFVPGVVPPLVRLIPGPTKSVHQLRYRTVDGAYVVGVSVELPSDEGYAVEPANKTTGGKISGYGAEGGLELTGERNDYSSNGAALTESPPVEEMNPDGEARSEPAEAHVESTEAEKVAEVVEPTPLSSEILIGVETLIEVLLPDSTMDISIQVSNTSPLEPHRVPELLRNYLHKLSTFFTTDADMFQPDPPQSFFLGDKYYILVTNTSGRHGIAPVSSNAPGSTVTTESTLDLENNAQISFTQVSDPIL
ncbi:hypothetical protein FRC10_009667 [Ceratobasidium sp. 414]|nr:hypothetical protein FRC10_009667 [Ceratobasidium sp. 414]